jgi:hypothetical protein
MPDHFDDFAEKLITWIPVDDLKDIINQGGAIVYLMVKADGEGKFYYSNSFPSSTLKQLIDNGSFREIARQATKAMLKEMEKPSGDLWH